MAYKCYIITNMVNGKLYIGKTKNSIENRFYEHIKASRLTNKRRTSINFAIAKYGHENFSINILCDNLSEKEASESEIYYINLYDTYKNGYNETHGGDGGGKLKFKTETLISILEDYCCSISLADLSAKYNFKYNAIFDVTRLKFSENHKIDKDLIKRVKLMKYASKKRKKVTNNDVIDIIKDFINGKSMTQIANERKLSVSNVFSIVWRDTFCEVELPQEYIDKLKIEVTRRAKIKRKLGEGFNVQWPQEKSNKES